MFHIPVMKLNKSPQVKDSSGGLVGSFEDLGDSAQMQDCSPTGKYVTHSGPVAKDEVKVAWRAPEQLTGAVTVYATVVQVILQVGDSGRGGLERPMACFFKKYFFSSGQEHILGETSLIRNHGTDGRYCRIIWQRIAFNSLGV